MPNIESVVFDTLHFLLLFVILFGIFGNLLTFRIFLIHSLRLNSIAIYFRTIATIDSLMLLRAFLYFIEQKYDIDLRNLNGFLCRFKEYFFDSTGAISPWLMVVVSIDRLINIRFPRRFSFLFKLPFQITTIFSVCIFNYAMYWPMASYSILIQGKRFYFNGYFF